MTATRFAAKFALPLAAVLLVVLAGCQGVYVAGDAGPHSSRDSPRNR
jgi:hypothetical protein